MTRRALWVALPLLGLAVAGAALLLWDRAQHRKASTERARERLLIGFNPRSVRRVSFRVGNHQAELQRQHAEWEPVTGSAPSAGVRVDVLLERLATLKVRPARRPNRRRVAQPKGRPEAVIRVWRGRAHILVVRLYRHKGGLLLTTTDRPGVYRAKAGLLALLEREVGRSALPQALALTPHRLASVELVTQQRVVLVRRTGRWYLEEKAALAPADSAAVGRLLRTLQGMRITLRVGKGSAARTQHGLDRPAVQIKVDDGSLRSLRLGGKCPRGKGARLAALGDKNIEVVCVTLPDPKALEGPFLSNRLFSAAPDEIRAASITRGKRTLAVVNRPGSGGWTMISPSLGKVDQAAAAGFVAALSRLRGQPQPARIQHPPQGAKRIGEAVLTPLTGSDERVEIWAPKSGRPLWVRRIGGSRWFTLRPKDDELAAGDPVLLRSRAICTTRADGIIRVQKTGTSPVTEVAIKEGPTWRLVLLRGRQKLERATRITSKLEDYRPATKRSTTRMVELGWKRPVLLVGQPDRANFAVLLHQVARIRAARFVAGRARKAHGFGKRSPRLTYIYEHNCKKQGAKRKCQHARCRVELGAPAAGGGCYARQPGSREVFVASSALCRTIRAPVASRQAVSLPMHRLGAITLGVGGKTCRLERAARGGWKRPADIAPGRWEAGASVLLTLAPLTATTVVGYGGPRLAKPLVTVVLSAAQVPPIRLSLHPSTLPSSPHVWLIKQGSPVRYRVPRRMADGLVRLVTGR